jgi:hypothetical protein
VNITDAAAPESARGPAAVAFAHRRFDHLLAPG